MLKEKAPCKCVSIKMLDFVIKANKKYYPQTHWEECKYVEEKTKSDNFFDIFLVFVFFFRHIAVSVFSIFSLFIFFFFR